jgi:putative peptidoglycan lipid II flippase
MPIETRPQTAIQGVTLATTLNVVSKILVYLRQLLITAYFGLSMRLDAFFIATSVVAIFINTFGDIFDSAGIPSLVRTRERDGEGPFRALTGSIFSLSLLLGLGLSLLMILCFPLAPYLVPGFPREAHAFIDENLYLLVPYALVFLPYHAIGSFFRSVRGFHVYYLVELLVCASALGIVYLFGNTVRIVPISLSAAYGLGLLAFLLWGRNRFHYRGKLAGGEMNVVRTSVMRMLPVYVVLYSLIVVDRYFASFLESGSISALFYGYILATALPTIMNIENVFVTSLSEESDRGYILTRILSGVWIVSLPVVAFALFFSEELVRGLFERGAFTPRSSLLTAEALRFYVLGLPAFFALPVCIRTLQVFSRFRWITALSVASVALNAALNALFVLRLGMGVKGIALATSLSWAMVGGSGYLLVSRLGVRVRYREMMGVFPGSLAAVAAGIAVSALLPLEGPPWAVVLLRGAAFISLYAVAMLLLPGGEMCRVRGIVLESFPRIRKRMERFLRQRVTPR